MVGDGCVAAPPADRMDNAHRYLRAHLTLGRLQGLKCSFQALGRIDLAE